MSARQAIDELVDAWERSYVQGQDCAAETLCPDQPELIDVLRTQIEARRAQVDAQRQRGDTASYTPTGVSPPPLVPPSLPGFDILERLGVGAVGEVWKAYQPALKRHVAIKFMRRDALLDLSAVQRFRQEAKAIAQLHRSDIVHIYDVCIPEDGKPPYLVLEYVDGGTLAQKINGVPWEPLEAAAFIEEIARAMHVVHRHGIVHRDLKPANILLAKQTRLAQPTGSGSDVHTSTRYLLGELVPKITDFGLAKRFDRLPGATATHTEERTQTGLILGTPNYMAPEQARGEPGKIGPPADVHALGAILYELLTGRPPFRAANYLDTLLMVIHTEPVPVRILQPEVPRDLDSICLTCLHKLPELRYTSAGALAEDLRRFQLGEPVQANPVGRLEKVLRWCGRNFRKATLVLLLMLGLALVVMVLTFWATTAQYKALSYRDEYEAALKEKTAADALKTAAETKEAAGEQRVAALKMRWQSALLGQAVLLWDRDPDLVRALLNDAANFPADERDLAWRFCSNLRKRGAAAPWLLAWARPDFGAQQTMIGSGQAITALALGKGSKTLAAADRSGRITLWDLDDGGPPLTLAGQRGPVTALAFCDHARILAACAGGKVVERWHETTGEPAGLLGVPRRGLVALTLAANNSLLAVGCQNGNVLIWDAGDDETMRALPVSAAAVTALEWAPDGKTMVSADATGRLWLRTLDSSATDLAELRPLARVRALAVSPSGNLFASGGKNIIQLWLIGERKEAATLQGHLKDIQTLAFSLDGATLASGDVDGTIALWDVQSGQERVRVRAHQGKVTALVFSRDGRSLISAGEDGAVRVWDVSSK